MAIPSMVNTVFKSIFFLASSSALQSQVKKHSLVREENAFLVGLNVAQQTELWRIRESMVRRNDTVPAAPEVQAGEGNTNVCPEGTFDIASEHDCRLWASLSGYTYGGRRPDPEFEEKLSLRPKGCWANTFRVEKFAYWNVDSEGGLPTDHKKRHRRHVKPLCSLTTTTTTPAACEGRHTCQNGGTVTGTGDACGCSCNDAFSGDACEIATSCEGRYTCNNAGTVTGTGDACNCTCLPEWTGDNCEVGTPCEDRFECGNGGSATGAGDSCSCICTDEWTGNDCAEPAPCEGRHACLNGGTATGTGNSCGCSCPDAFTGDSCETEASCEGRHTCQNGGTVLGTGNSCGCQCTSGFTGDFCETPKSCEGRHTCQNGGTVTGSGDSCGCSCTLAWQGEDCQSPKPCIGRHTCNNGGTATGSGDSCGCSCPAEFEGATCGTGKTCHGRWPCYNRGSVQGSGRSCSCSCPSMTSGANCDHWHAPQSLGCFNDDADVRWGWGGNIVGGLVGCAHFCRSYGNGSPYMGLQFNPDNPECWCSSNPPWSSHHYSRRPDADCNGGRGGDSRKPGGHELYAIAIYKIM